MVNDNFIQECKNRAYANRLGKLEIDGIDLPITNNDNLQRITLDNSCYVDGNIIGTIYIKKLTGEFVAFDKNIQLVDKSLNAEIGVKYTDNTTEYIGMGKYNIHSIKDEKTSSMSQIIAYDNLIKKIDDVYVCGIDYSQGNITIKELYIDLCNQLELIPKNVEFLNNNIPISNNPFRKNEKNRVVLQTILKIACSFSVIDNDQIDLCWLSTNEVPDYIFEKSDYSTLEGGIVKYGPVNSLTIKNSQVDDENVSVEDTESVSINGETSIIINEDYILNTPELREMAINNIFNRINGLTYYDTKLITYYGKPFLPIGAKIRIMINDNDYIDTYNLKHYFEYDGTFNSTIESPSLTKEAIKVKQNANSLAEKLYDTAINVDKQNEKINAIVMEQENQFSKVSQIEITNNSIQNTVNSLKTITDDISNHTSTIEKSVTQLQTDTYTKLQIDAKLIDGSVKKISTTTLTADENGLTVDKGDNSKTKTNIDADGLEILDKTGSSEEVLLEAKYDEEIGETRVRGRNFVVEKYLTIGKHSRIEDYENGTGVFYLG